MLSNQKRLSNIPHFKYRHTATYKVWIELIKFFLQSFFNFVVPLFLVQLEACRLSRIAWFGLYLFPKYLRKYVQIDSAKAHCDGFIDSAKLEDTLAQTFLVIKLYHVYSWNGQNVILKSKIHITKKRRTLLKCFCRHPSICLGLIACDPTFRPPSAWSIGEWKLFHFYIQVIAPSYVKREGLNCH